MASRTIRWGPERRGPGRGGVTRFRAPPAGARGPGGAARSRRGLWRGGRPERRRWLFRCRSAAGLAARRVAAGRLRPPAPPLPPPSPPRYRADGAVCGSTEERGLISVIRPYGPGRAHRGMPPPIVPPRSASSVCSLQPMLHLTAPLAPPVAPRTRVRHLVVQTEDRVTMPS